MKWIRIVFSFTLLCVVQPNGNTKHCATHTHTHASTQTTHTRAGVCTKCSWFEKKRDINIHINDGCAFYLQLASCVAIKEWPTNTDRHKNTHRHKQTHTLTHTHTHSQLIKLMPKRRMRNTSCLLTAYLRQFRSIRLIKANSSMTCIAQCWTTFNLHLTVHFGTHTHRYLCKSVNCKVS